VTTTGILATSVKDAGRYGVRRPSGRRGWYANWVNPRRVKGL